MNDVKFKVYPDEKVSDKSPDFKGKFLLENGEKKRMAVWKNEDGSLYCIISDPYTPKKEDVNYNH